MSGRDAQTEEQRALLDNANDNDEEGNNTTTLAGRPAKRFRWRIWAACGVFSWAVIATIAVAMLAVAYHRLADKTADPPLPPHGKRNLIFMVSDGMGPTSLALTRSYMQW